MVLVLDCQSEIGALVRSDLAYLICLRHLLRSRTVANQFFLYTCATCSELPSNIITLVSSEMRIAYEVSSERKNWEVVVGKLI